jgi:hypothetical protein
MFKVIGQVDDSSDSEDEVPANAHLDLDVSSDGKSTGKFGYVRRLKGHV